MISKSIFRFLVSLIFSCFLAWKAIPGLSHASSVPTSKTNNDQIKIIESELTREKQKYEEFDAQEKDLVTQLSDLEEEVAKKRHVVEELRGKIAITTNTIKKLEAKLADEEKLLIKVESKAAERIVALYKYARRGYIKVLANVRGPDQFWQRLKYLKAIMEEDQKLMLNLAREVQIRKDEICNIKKELVEKESIGQKERAQLSSLRKDLEEKVIRLMKIHKEKEFYETAVKELQLAAKDLKQTLLNIEKKKTYKIPPSSRFVNSKGRLPLPLEGKIVRADKLSGSARLKLNKGIFIEHTYDSRVRAVFPGRVDFSGSLKGYGEVIVINHGSRFFTISAYLFQRKKVEGDIVEGGEIIGAVEPDGSSIRSRFYFEIRKAGQNLNPLAWLKIK